MNITPESQAAAMAAGAILNQSGVGLYQALNTDLMDFKNIAPLRPADLSAKTGARNA